MTLSGVSKTLGHFDEGGCEGRSLACCLPQDVNLQQILLLC